MDGGSVDGRGLALFPCPKSTGRGGIEPGCFGRCILAKQKDAKGQWSEISKNSRSGQHPGSFVKSCALKHKAIFPPTAFQRQPNQAAPCASGRVARFVRRSYLTTETDPFHQKNVSQVPFIKILNDGKKTSPEPPSRTVDLDLRPGSDCRCSIYVSGTVNSCEWNKVKQCNREECSSSSQPPSTSGPARCCPMDGRPAVSETQTRVSFWKMDGYWIPCNILRTRDCSCAGDLLLQRCVRSRLQ